MTAIQAGRRQVRSAGGVVLYGRRRPCGVHAKSEGRDALVISTKDYDDFIARVTYRMQGGNSALYFRAEETEAPWVLRGFQNEIANGSRDSALWHTAGIIDGKTIPGRGWVVTNDEFIEKVRNKDGQWNTTCTAAYGDRLVQILNGFCTSDIVDERARRRASSDCKCTAGPTARCSSKTSKSCRLPRTMTCAYLKLIERK
jgi:hypothetical protein